jgi:hypothetical protein
MRRFERRHVGAIPAGGTYIGWQLDESSATVLVSCPRNTRYFVAIKMGRRQGARREHI